MNIFVPLLYVSAHEEAESGLDGQVAYTSLQKRSPYIEHINETTDRHVSLYSLM